MRAVAALALLLGGCTVDDLDLSGRACPCVDGWVCDSARNVCVEASGADAGRGDAGRADGGGMDAGSTDAGPVDAGATDAGASDAGPVDAGATDAGPPPMDAGHDAGRPDAGHDAGPPAPPSRCGTTHAGRAFCDGFDTGDASRWANADSDALSSMRAVVSPVYRGSHAMRFDSPRGAEWAVVLAQPWGGTGPQPADIWLRAYYYFPSSHPPSMELMQIGDDEWTQTAVGAIWAGGGVANWHAHGYLGGAYHDTSTTIPLDTWVCVELHVSTRATGGGAELFVDGTLMHGDLALDATPRPMTFIDSVYVGLVYTEATDADQVVFVDEVVADGTRIGCDPP